LATQNFRVKNGLEVGTGVTISAGIITATSFDGIGSNITQINASNISSGTLSNSRLPSDINVSGIITATSFDGDELTISNAYISGISTFVGLSTFGNSVFIGGALDVNDNINFNGDLLQNNSPFVASRWVETLSGIHTTTNVGIGTTNPTSKLTVVGDVNVIGIITNATFNNTILKYYSETIINGGNTGSNATINVASGGYFTYTLDQSTSFTFNIVGLQTGVNGFAIQLKNGSGGPYSITWPVSVYWPDGGSVPSRNTTDGRTDIWSFVTTDQGTTWLGNLAITNYIV
jgi:hypothetical protein